MYMYNVYNYGTQILYDIFSKSPILSSYIIDLRNFDEKIINVKDFQFLHGYYEPTVFILFEPLQTWAG